MACEEENIKLTALEDSHFLIVEMAEDIKPVVRSD
jgi:hypothetical protein